MSVLLSEETMEKVKSGSSDCPRCGFPVHGPTMRVHVGRTRDEYGGGMRDLLPAFHRVCGREHLSELSRLKRSRASVPLRPSLVKLEAVA